MPPTPLSDPDRNLYQRGPAIYFRMVVVGPEGPKEVNQSLGRVDWDTARRVRDVLVQTLEGAALCARMGLEFQASPLAQQFGVDAMLERVKLLRRRIQAASIAEVCRAFELDCDGRGISTDNRGSGYKAVSSLKLVVRTVKGDVDLEKTPATVLTPQLLEDYQAAKVKAAIEKGPAAVKTARTTIASTINQARMVVSERALQQENMRKLGLPDLEEFRAWKAEGTTRKVRRPVDDEVLARLRLAMDDLWFQAPARWLAAALCGNLGLRRGSAVMARWTWARRVGGKWRLFVVATDEAEPKGNEYSVEIDDGLWKDMCEVRQGGDYIVPGETLEARDAVFDANVDWLRGLGLNVNKPNHELRAVFAQAMDRAHGRAAASAALGHSEEKTTAIYTGRAQAAGSVRPL